MGGGGGGGGGGVAGSLELSKVVRGGFDCLVTRCVEGVCVCVEVSASVRFVYQNLKLNFHTFLLLLKMLR